MNKSLHRCAWAQQSQIEQDYHDTQWGVPTHDDTVLFEFLILEGAQAGLSWRTILEKREGYRQAFDNFAPHKVARYDEQKIQELTNNPAIIRNKLKIRSTVRNAQIFVDIQQEYGSFSNYIWSFVDNTPIVNSWEHDSEVPAQTKLSQTISTDLKQRGMSFVGPTIIYSYLQAIGIINDHITSCVCYKQTTN
jgi:DNA-3-methyladenine glycosylase I